MADLKILKIGGVDYNVGFSTNDLTDELKGKIESALQGVQVDGTDLAVSDGNKVNLELKSKLDAAQAAAITASAVTMTETAGGEGDNFLKKYVFSQNGVEIATINTAKDLVVTSGQVVEVENVKYLRLTIANQEAPVDIAVTDLVDVYTAGAYIEVSAANEIAVKFAELDTALMAETAQVGAAIKNLEEVIKTITGTEGEVESVGTQITNAINALKGEGYSGKTLKEQEEAIAAAKGAADAAQKTADDHIANTDVHITSAEREKLAGISEGANKVSTAYDESTATLSITIE